MADEQIPRQVIVASHNPVKINAALQGFTLMFPKSTYSSRGVAVPSGVPEQPLSDEETLLGATNRAENARALEPGADYWVGIEGGIDEDNGSLRSFAWVVVIEKEGGRLGRART